MTRPLVAVYLAVSLDGQIARSDGRLEWLDRFATSGEDYGYDAFISSIDAIILGRNTYETALGFGIWPYRNLRVIVLTHRPLDARHGEIAYNGELAPLLKKLHEDGVRKAYLDGGDAARLAGRLACDDDDLSRATAQRQQHVRPQRLISRLDREDVIA